MANVRMYVKERMKIKKEADEPKKRKTQRGASQVQQRGRVIQFEDLFTSYITLPQIRPTTHTTHTPHTTNLSTSEETPPLCVVKKKTLCLQQKVWGTPDEKEKRIEKGNQSG